MANDLSLNDMKLAFDLLSDWSERGPLFAAVANSSPPELRILFAVSMPAGDQSQRPGPSRFAPPGNPTVPVENLISIKSGDPEYAAIWAAIQAAAVRISGVQTDVVNAQLAVVQTALNSGVAPATPITVDTSGVQVAVAPAVPASPVTP